MKMKTKTCGIYKITSPTNKIYIGQSIDIEYRWTWYYSLDCKSQTKLHHSLKKHGVENHTFEIIEECIQELLNEREIHWIKHFDSFNTQHGMNLRSGGEGGLMSEETIKKISEANKGYKHSKETLDGMRKPKSEEHRKNISMSKMGNKNGAGRRTEEQNKRNSMSKMGNKYGLGTKRTEETKKKQSEKMKGTKQSSEHIAKRIKIMKEKRELKQHIIQSVVFRFSVIKMNLLYLDVKI